MIIYDYRETQRPDSEYERMIPMKCKIITWDEFREMRREDAQSWYYSRYSSDDLSSCFTPDEVAQKTLDYLEEMEG